MCSLLPRRVKRRFISMDNKGHILWVQVGVNHRISGLSIQPIDTPSQYALSIYPLNTPSKHNAPYQYQHTLSTHPFDIPYQYPPSTHPTNPPLSMHPPTPLLIYIHPINTHYPPPPTLLLQVPKTLGITNKGGEVRWGEQEELGVDSVTQDRKKDNV